MPACERCKREFSRHPSLEHACSLCLAPVGEWCSDPGGPVHPARTLLATDRCPLGNDVHVVEMPRRERAKGRIVGGLSKAAKAAQRKGSTRREESDYDPLAGGRGTGGLFDRGD